MDWILKQLLWLLFVTISISQQAEVENKTLSQSPASIVEEGIFSQKINDFGFRLLKTMMEQNANKNVAIGPTSVAGLLAMTLLGSVGETYDELVHAVGFSQDILSNRKNHEQFGELLEQLGRRESEGSGSGFASAVVVDRCATLRPLYRSFVQRVYHADVLTADFKNSSHAQATINKWIEQHTGGRICDLLKQPLPLETRLVLLSAQHFSGQWAFPFVPEYTTKMSFRRPSGPVQADLMLNYGKFRYISAPLHELHMVALPYNDSASTMYALKPLHPKRLSLPALLERINWSTIHDLIDHMTNQTTVIRFPKMGVKGHYNLVNALKALNITSFFDRTRANFALMLDGKVGQEDRGEEELITRINSKEIEGRELRERIARLPNPGLYVDSVLHDVEITVDEFGTEAVAATAGVLSRSAASFYADSPFLCFIRNEVTGLVTFSAIVFDPTA